jgi:hypothetical protein
MTTSKGKLDAVYSALVAILNNIGAYVEGLSPTTCSRILQLFASMSAPSFLLANETNHTLLCSLLEFINAIVEHQFASMPHPSKLLYRAQVADKYQKIHIWFTVSSRRENGSKPSEASLLKVDSRSSNVKIGSGKRTQAQMTVSPVPPRSRSKTYAGHRARDCRRLIYQKRIALSPSEAMILMTRQSLQTLHHSLLHPFGTHELLRYRHQSMIVFPFSCEGCRKRLEARCPLGR